MKKALLIAAIAGFVMTSCKKDYVCSCKIDGDTIEATYKDVKKKDATTACDQAETAAKVLDAAATCDLK